MKKKYYVQKTEMIEVDEPAFEKLAKIYTDISMPYAKAEDYQEAINRAEAITGIKVRKSTKDWGEGITAIYTEEGTPIFEVL